MSYLFDLLKERVSANAFAGGTISDSELKALIEKACRAPTGYNLQNWHFTAVRSTATKQALFEAAFSQPKILQAAAVIAVSGDLLGYQSLSEKLQPSVQAGLMSDETAQRWTAVAQDTFHQNIAAQRDEAIRSASLAAMVLMLAAQEQGWASCPMSGFDTEAVSKALSLPENYLPVLLLAIGKPTGEQQQKIRLDVDKVLDII